MHHETNKGLLHSFSVCLNSSLCVSFPSLVEAMALAISSERDGQVRFLRSEFVSSILRTYAESASISVFDLECLNHATRLDLSYLVFISSMIF